jgi:hypothetical protein
MHTLGDTHVKHPVTLHATQFPFNMLKPVEQVPQVLELEHALHPGSAARSHWRQTLLVTAYPVMHVEHTLG